MTRLIHIFLFIWISSLPLAAQQITVRAGVDNPVLTEGQTGTYTIQIQNTTSVPDIPPPEAAGITFSGNASVSNYTQIINGRTTMEVRLSWSFRPSRTGRFEIPGRTIQLQGRNYNVPATIVEVQPMSEEMRSRFLLEWDLPDGDVYVGQTFSANLKLYVRRGVEAQLERMPEHVGERFLSSPFPNNPKQENTTRNGISYTLVTWTTELTPIQTGPAELSANIGLRFDTGRVDRSTFFARPIQESIQLNTGYTTISVRDLPPGAPPGFNNSIGQFKVTATLDTHKARVGEPLTLKITYAGQGNFQRMRAPELSGFSGWRIYPPKSQFIAEGESTSRGQQVYEFLIVPESTDITTVPSIQLATFNPQTKAYQTILIEEQKVEVAPSNMDGSSLHSFARDNRLTQNGQTATRGDVLQPIRADFGKPSSNLTPVWRNQRFWLIQGILSAFFISATLILLRQRNSQTNRKARLRREQERRIQQYLQQARKASAQQDAAAFYNHAQRCIQEAVHRRMQREARAESLHLGDIEMLLQGQIDSENMEDIRSLFTTADALKFSGFSHSASQLEQDFAKLERIIRLLLS